MIALPLALLLAAAPGPVSKVRLAEKPSDALGGRLLLRLPEGVQREAREHSIMGAEAPEENETRFVLDAENVRLVVMVNDLFATTTGGGLADVVKKTVAAGEKKLAGAKIEPLPLQGLAGARLTLPKPDCDEEGCLAAAAWIASAEGEIEYVALYTNPAGAEETAALGTLATGIFSSLAPGARTLSLAEGERSLLGFGDKGALAATLPRNAALSIERGPDFDVVRIHLLRPLGTPPASLGIYVGGFPSFHPRKEAPARTETLLGVETRWYSSSHGSVVGEEALVAFPEDDEAPFLHLFLSGDAAQAPALRAIASSLHFAARPDAGKKPKKK